MKKWLLVSLSFFAIEKIQGMDGATKVVSPRARVNSPRGSLSGQKMPLPSNLDPDNQILKHALLLRALSETNLLKEEPIDELPDETGKDPSLLPRKHSSGTSPRVPTRLGRVTSKDDIMLERAASVETRARSSTLT